MTIASGTQGMVARLPLLGPLLGWTRRDPNAPARLLTRLWVKADDSDSQPAVMALTARWDGGVVKGSVRLWRVCTAALGGTQPPSQERFALADIGCGPGDSGIVRIVTVHLTRDVTASSDGIRFSQPAFASINIAQEIPAAQPVGANAPPRPQEVPFDEVFPNKAALTPEKFAADLFRDLEDRLADARAPRLPGETRPTPKERAARIELCEAVLRPDRCASPRLRFAAGSCRHPGIGFDRDLADRALSALSQRAGGGDGPELVLMLGDQIYADATAGVIDAEDRLEKYTTRYAEAFDSQGFRRLARRVPLYMAGDDHEIRDNWPKDSVPPGAAQDLKKLFERSEEWARLLFLAHQRSHGPDQPAWAPPGGGGKGLWYAFDAGPLPFFCFDSRFERSRDGKTMMDPYQLDCFRAWLAAVCARPDGQTVPKFILSGSVFAPAERAFAGQPEYARRADGWAGYPDERAAVMSEIIAREAQNSVFISGDYHCGAVASLHFSGAAGALRCYSVVAPPFYAPFPFANMPARNVAVLETFDSTGKNGGKVAVECRATAFDTVGFALLSVKPPPKGADPLDWEIGVEYHADEWNQEDRVGSSLQRAARLAGGEATLL